ncbi:MAG: tryptophan synthase subunit alpha, partial [Gemmatimonadetes bacterium]|nr:tryptophan synthase subunit alpha [Gemmatimonadota bacterium]
DRVRRLCELSQGFVYAVTRTGVTGRSGDCTSDMLDYLDRVRATSPIPVLAGFGIRVPSHVRAVASHVDGVIVGSALIEVLERGDDPVAFLRTLRDENGTPSRELA